MMRKANDMEATAARMAAARAQRRAQSALTGPLERLLRYRLAFVAAAAHILCCSSNLLVSSETRRQWTAALRLDPSWFYPFTGIFALPFDTSGALSIAAWAALCSLVCEMAIKFFAVGSSSDPPSPAEGNAARKKVQ